MVRYGFILRDDGFTSPKSTTLECPGLLMEITGVLDFETACAKAKKMADVGVDFIELCGDFGEEHSQEIIAAVEGRIPVGYVTYSPEEADKLAKLFG